jgi:hypothetical protein
MQTAGAVVCVHGVMPVVYSRRAGRGARSGLC